MSNQVLSDAERAKLAAAIKHFEALQKRYTRQHNGTACEYVRLALEGLKRMEQEPEAVRCGECYTRRILGAMYCNHLGSPRFFHRVKPNDTCEYGERRKEQNNEAN